MVCVIPMGPDEEGTAVKDALRRQPDFDQFLKVLKREGKPDRLPFFGGGGGFEA